MCVHISDKNGKVYLKRQRIKGSKITDDGATEVLARMNQTSVHQDKDAQWKYFRTDKTKACVTKQLAMFKKILCSKI